MTLLEVNRPVYGQSLLPQVLDEHKDNDPTRVYASCGTSTVDGDAAHFPYDKSFSEAENDPILHIHSSGSTGDPKIITTTNGTVAVTDNDRNIPTPEGRKPQNGAQFQFNNGGRFYTCFPPYHLAGVQAYLILPTFYSNATVVIGPQDVPPTGQLMINVIRYQEKSLKAFYVPPLIVEQWANTDEGMKQSQQLDFILYGGGPLSTKIGNRLSQNTDVCQMYGSAEVGQIQLLVPQRDEWAYMEWNPYEEGDMQPNGDNTFEMVLHQNDKFHRSRSLSHNFPHIKEWRMGDLFSPHPTKPHLWKFYSRVDDIIVLPNSHKVNPIPIESQIRAHPLLSGALVVGSGKPQLALLLELVENSHLENARYLINDIWPSIELVNQTLPAYACISRSKLLIGNPAKPFLRTPKGSVVRNTTIELYAREIASLYENEESPDVGHLQDSRLEGKQFEDILAFVRSLMCSVLCKHLINDNQNLFEAGMDSVKVFEVLDTISNNVSKYIHPSKGFKFSPNTIYQNPTISELSRRLHSTINDIIPQGPEAEIKNEMNRLIDKYTMDLPQRQFKPFPALPTSRKTVLLTGATGSLGSQVLRELEQNPDIDKIFCFSRSKGLNSISIQKSRNCSLTSHNGYENKIENIIVDLSKSRFNLSDYSYQYLLSTVNVIIHLAWKVDFNLNLQSFESNFLYSIRSFVNFSLEANSILELFLSLPRPTALTRLLPKAM
ncbi:L-aminoadipate-semialdehyde dehydrogenase large subunit [Talaromyces islandicus]|uniref:L-aminoadipate-semialdehyde dehydrogenase large subunit n=1 Tax=Talaromyces islandicus TaxID=28573 RepID=A0A0U1M0A4_TALIS|nr:L-aminoadipate-semialdehyde dehydrogenase large subunit [Talaromyces islandicus]